jgi:hypothetical protein
MQGAFFFITTGFSAIVGCAPSFGIGASASIVGRGRYSDHTSCVHRSATSLENRVIHFQPGRIYKDKPPIAGPLLH